MYRTTLCLRPLLLIACLGLVAGCDDGSGVGPGADGAIHPDADLNTNQNANQNPPVDAAVPEPDAAVQLDPFSFFVTSLAALRDLSGSQNGFGGDLSYGFTGPGAGLQGADELCAVIAERSMPGARVKQWRAFLSVTADENGDPVDARDRIGNGPWYDRLGRLLAPDLDDLLNPRPLGGDATIRDDFPNEDGVPNHQPDPTQPEVDNHDMLTGSDEYGQLYSASGTCRDWTAATGGPPPRGALLAAHGRAPASGTSRRRDGELDVRPGRVGLRAGREPGRDRRTEPHGEHRGLGRRVRRVLLLRAHAVGGLP
jgi:hypothetical protein